jgi:hypothetical protein
MMLITIEKPINEKTDVLQLLTNARKITKVLTILNMSNYLLHTTS